MASGSKPPSGKDRAGRAARERARLYQARAAYHQGQQRRRTRDNWTAGIVAGVLILGAIGSQVLYYTVGPAAPEPAPTQTTSPSPTPTQTTSPSPTPSATPTGEPVPGPTETP
ncbi:hypothetical protein ACPW96_10930 [Micromonospora sp. DT81.3]|uniref:hypothetical protein n=1 Tax=Micromonospora sp. DT81.3 TaxID=3416523 RepID=UPI003CECF3E3